ncbi:helix-turn-helix domain-containing protein [Actinomadura kijaniata]|uniref:helix-turn-helix domain-containing protein n=1 Tax=Actinomadura kijaniata TaxID=46161 RepID=UPI003F1DF87C
MSVRRRRSGTSPALLAFGRRFRRLREAKGWTQEALAARANNGAGVKAQYIGMIENGRTRCNEKFAAQMDDALDANGELVTLWADLVQDSAYPAWFDWPPIEAAAVQLADWQPRVISGLLQTPDYMRAFLTSEDAVEARLKRQEVLTRTQPAPVLLVALFDERVLERAVCSREAMYEQIEHLLEMSGLPNVIVQIVPDDCADAGNGGAFVMATLEDRTQVAHLDTEVRGITTDDPEDLASLDRSLAILRGRALPEDQSRDVMRKALERWK